MGNLEVAKLSHFDRAKLPDLPRAEEVVAVITATHTVPVGALYDQSLDLDLEIVAGPRKGQHIHQFIVLWSIRTPVENEGHKELESLFRALKMDWPSDSAELIGRRLVLHLKRERGSEDRPYAQYLPCSEARDEENRRWLKNEAKSLFAEAARKEPKPEEK